MLDARPARRATILFGCVLVMIGAVVGWWWILNLQTAAREREQQAKWMRAEALWAQRLFSRSVDPLAERLWLEKHHPHLQFVCDDKTPQACSVEVAPAQIEALSGRFAARVRMFVGEGATLVILLALGAALVLRAMYREVQMVRQQGNFLAAVTHELKSPLATIRLYAETLRRRRLSEEKAVAYLTTLDEETRRLEGLVNNVLLASRLTQKPAAQRAVQQPTDLVAATEQSISAVRMNLNIEWTRPKQPVWAAIDPNDWQTICRNLFDNARKYGQGAEPARVRLVATSRGLALLSVADRGLGLARSHLKRVFERFYRVGDELVRAHEGSGLGLFLVHALVKAAGGKTWVESLGLHQGATFFVALPTVQHSAAVFDEQTESSIS